DLFTGTNGPGDRGAMTIRLAIVGLPKLLEDVIVSVFRDDDAVQIDHLPDDEPLDLTAGRPRHDVIIFGVTDPQRNPLLNQISVATKPTLLAVSTDGRESWIYRMLPRPHRLGSASPAQIRAAVLAVRDP